MKNHYLILFAIALTVGSSHAVDAETEELPPLTLESAVARVVAAHPVLSAAESEWKAVQAEAVQAGLRPNPVFGAEAENLVGSGPFSGVDAAEYTFSLSQTFELGGKRRKRMEAAVLQGRVAGWSLEERRRTVEQQAIRAFYTALAVQSRLELSTRQLELAQSVVDRAHQRVEAGRANRLEVTKARIELADVQLEQKTMMEMLAADRQLLASLWGGSAEEIGPLAGDLERVAAPPDMSELTSRLKDLPPYRAADAAVRQAQAMVAAEDALRIPNVDFNAGVRLFEESDDQAFVAGLSIPLAFGNRNQGNREAARMRVLRAQQELFAVQLDIQRELVGRSRAVQVAYETVKALENQQVPIAREAFAQASAGYEKGLFSSLDLLDAMRGLFAQETRHVNALLEYHLVREELKALVAPSPQPNTTQQPDHLKE